MALYAEQQRAFEAVKEGRSIVLTGPGGCGKSYLIEKIKEYALAEDKTIGITGLTGVAASLIGGVTIHSWGHVGVGEDSVQDLTKRICQRKHFRDRWRNTSILVIDEISMMDPTFFNKLNEVAKQVRRNNAFFGGLQFIACGDFAQLPPVVKGKMELKFAFETSLWKENFGPDNTYVLDKVMRQDDARFAELLHRIRMGIVTREDMQLLRTRVVSSRDEAQVIEIEDEDGNVVVVEPTVLYPRRADVEALNKEKLNALIGSGKQKHVLRAIDKVYNTKTKEYKNLTDTHRRILANLDTKSPVEIELCINAQVMLTRNINQKEGLVNGSRGVINRFVDGCPEVIFDNGCVLLMERVDFEIINGVETITRSQFPLVLAWAMTIHKSQGSTLTFVVTDLRDVFSFGQVYVVLSRVRSLDGLTILNLREDKIWCHPKVKEYYDELAELKASASATEEPQ